MTARRVVLTGTHPLGDAIAGGLVANGASVARVATELASEAEIDRALAEAEDALGGIDQIVHAWMAAPLLDAVEFDAIDEIMWAECCEHTLAVAWWLARNARRSLRPTRGALTFVVPTVGLSGAAGFAMLAAVAEGVRVLAKGCARQWGRRRDHRQHRRHVPTPLGARRQTPTRSIVPSRCPGPRSTAPATRPTIWRR